MNYKYIKRKSKLQENRTAKEFNGRTTVASGAMYHSKGDVKTSTLLIENKYTDAPFYMLKLSVWRKIMQEATKEALRVPVMQLDLGGKSYIILDASFGQHLPLYAGWNNNLYVTSTADSVRIHSSDMERLNLVNFWIIMIRSTQLIVVTLDRFKRDFAEYM